MRMEKYISFLDILGFSDIILDNNLEGIMEKFKMVTGFIIPYSEFLGEWIATGNRDHQSNKKCSSFSFSDTFVLYTKDSSHESLNNIIIATFLLTRSLFAVGFPVRGALTKGEADYIPNTNHLIGKAIINAARLEKQQEWFGVIISPDVLSKNNAAMLDEPTSQILAEYPVPFKNGENIPHMVINWRLNLVAKYGTKSLLPKPFDASSDVKIENTLKFAKHIRDTKQAYKRLNEKWQQTFFVADTDPTKVPIKHGDEY
jgi:hypothetical protein